MTNSLPIIRSLVIYGLCLPLAIFIGYLLAMPMDNASFIIVIAVVCLPLIPVLLRWHHPILIFSWNTVMVVFFVQGQPRVWIAMSVVSLVFSVLQYILNRKHRLLSVPSLTWPMLSLAALIFFTAEMTGGIGFRVAGSSTGGGSRYLLLFGAIVGYFALSCQRVPTDKGVRYMVIFLLGTLTMSIGNLQPFMDPAFNFLFAIFPVEPIASMTELGGAVDDNAVRFGLLAISAQSAAFLMFALHGVRGLFSIGEQLHFLPFRFRGGFSINQPWRLLVFSLCLYVVLMGGYRSAIILIGLVFVFHFYYERLLRTPLLPGFILGGILACALALPMATKMPLQIQRALSFLPITVDPVASYDAEITTEWRIRIWKTVLPTVPQYLLVGKGFGMNSMESELVSELRNHGGDSTDAAILAGDYHNGPLSLIIHLGVLGVLAFLWLFAAGFRVLLNNYRHGDPALRMANTFLLAYFLSRMVSYLAVFGSVQTELPAFAGILGLSVALNGGMCTARSSGAERTQDSDPLALPDAGG